MFSFVTDAVMFCSISVIDTRNGRGGGSYGCLMATKAEIAELRDLLLKLTSSMADRRGGSEAGGQSLGLSDEAMPPPWQGSAGTASPAL